MVATKRQILERDTLVRGSDIADSIGRLHRFLGRYRPLVARSEQASHLEVYIEGLCSSLERKSIEPIATQHGLYRRPLQHFVGAGKWPDAGFRTELRDHIVEEIADPDGIFVIDGSAVPKSGPESVGVERQWCGRLGKVDNCQIGVYLAYSARGSRVLVDGDLYLPQSWAEDPARRVKTHVPDDVVFRTSWQIADDLIRQHGPAIPHAWIVGDDEYGRPKEFRDALADRKERYLLEVPCNTSVRKPARWPGCAKKWRPVKKRKQKAPPNQWQRFKLRDGEKGPIEVVAFATRVETQRDGAPPRQEILLVVQQVDRSRVWYFLAPSFAPLNTRALVEVMAHRHDVEEVFELAKGEVGLDHYEVRSWVGWHHHITLSMLALWFLTLEQRRLGKKLPP